MNILRRLVTKNHLIDLNRILLPDLEQSHAFKKSFQGVMRSCSFLINGKPLLTIKQGVPQNLFSMTDSMHTSTPMNKEIGYSEFLQLKKTSLTVIDVRDKSEIQASGTIPGSLNIPLNRVGSALKKSPEDFKSSYGRSKPSQDQKLLFLCQRGVRSKAAMTKAIEMGYKKSMSFQGGWVNFSQNNNK